MISIEAHGDEDEIFVVDQDAKHAELQCIIRPDQVFLIQPDDVAGNQVISISKEMLEHFMVALQLDPGVYQVVGDEVYTPTLN